MHRLLLLALVACQTQGEDLPDDTTADTTAGDTTDTTSGDTTAPDDTTDPADPGDTTVAPASPLVDPGCLDGQWAEVPADPTVDISDLVAGFNRNAPDAFLIAALDRRYPIGSFIFQGGLASTGIGDCLASFTTARDRGSASGMMSAASTLVHECGHFFDLADAGRGAMYHLTDDISIMATGGSYADLPARSLINDDAWYDLRPACPANGSFGCDDYANIYLNGSPTNRQFESGDQGIDMLLEEAVQYNNSLASDYAFMDNLGRGMQISARDGILTFLWYTERYLHMLRTDYPAAYDDVVGDPKWRQLILAIWGRAWLYLELTDSIQSLGLDDDDLVELVSDPDLLAEIQAVRDAQGCP